MSLNAPNRMFLEITTECNLRCQLCKLWKNKDPIGKLSTNEKIQIIETLAFWLKNQTNSSLSHFSIIFTGGEPFRYPNQVLKLANTCGEIGFQSYVNTNGVLMQPFISKMVNSGLTAVTFSLDSHQASVHDTLRGFSGVFETVVDNIRKMLIERENSKSNQKIFVQSILGKWNVDVIDEHIIFFSELGVDGLTFQCLQYPFGLKIPANWHIGHPFFPSLDSVKRASKKLLEMKDQGYKINNSEEEISWWELYFKNPQYLPDQYKVCKASEQNIIIDVLGNVKFCFNKQLDPPDRIGNIARDKLDELWNGKNAQNVRQEMKNCNRSCGIMLCHCDSRLREQR